MHHPKLELYFTCDPFYFRALDRLATESDAEFGTQLRVVDAQVIKATEQNLDNYSFCNDDDNDEDLLRGFSMLTPTQAGARPELQAQQTGGLLPPASKSWTVLQPGDWTPNSSAASVSNAARQHAPGAGAGGAKVPSSPFGMVSGGDSATCGAGEPKPASGGHWFEKGGQRMKDEGENGSQSGVAVMGAKWVTAYS